MVDTVVIGDASLSGRFDLLRDWWRLDEPDWVSQREAYAQA